MLLTCVSLPEGHVIPLPRASVLCLGSFDGVHLAHQSLLKQGKAHRDRLFPHASVGVFCFREPPAAYLNASGVRLLCSLEERLARFAACGMEFAVLADFSDFRELSAEDYLSKILQKQCGAVGAVCGYNHRFGKNGAGNAALLRQVFGDGLLLVDEIRVRGVTVSSSEIRHLIGEKRMEEAAALLGRPYSITAPVEHGKALGRKWGFPTINQSIQGALAAPPRGVYRSRVTVDGTVYASLSNVGVRPTVDHAAEQNCETHLLGYSGDLYGRVLTVELLSYLREEKKFETQEALREQIERDLQSVKNN